VGQLLLTEAVRVAPVGVVAPFDYIQLVWATGLGFLIWGELPRSTTLAGALGGGGQRGLPSCIANWCAGAAPRRWSPEARRLTRRQLRVDSARRGGVCALKNADTRCGGRAERTP